MPFTPAHSAAVLPFVNSRYLSATALVAGSMAPDFEYFFRLNVTGVHGHTISGLFYFDLPVAVMLSIVFHSVVKKELFLNLPGFIRMRFSDTINLDYFRLIRQRSAGIIGSALLGAATHIFWDSFTHNGGYFAQNLDIYRGTFIPFAGTRYPLFFALQHLSTIFGGLAVVVFIARRRVNPQVQNSPVSLRYWGTILLTCALLLVVRFLPAPHQINPGNFIVTFISGFCVGLIVTGVMPWVRSLKSGDIRKK